MKVKGKVVGKWREFVLTPAQRDTIMNAQHEGGGHEQLYGRLAYAIRTRDDGTIVMKIVGDDVERLKKLAARNDNGTWQRLARELFAKDKAEDPAV
jgi:hypothetical protein